VDAFIRRFCRSAMMDVEMWICQRTKKSRGPLDVSGAVDFEVIRRASGGGPWVGACEGPNATLADLDALVGVGSRVGTTLNLLQNLQVATK
jgi:hypothetical protein